MTKQSLLERTARLAEKAVPPPPTEPEPLALPGMAPGGFIDIVCFEAAGRVIVKILDPAGAEIEVGHLIEDDDRITLRLPWSEDKVANKPLVRADDLREPASGTNKRAVLAHFSVQWPLARTDREVAEACGLSVSASAGRRHELIQDGWLVEGTKRDGVKTFVLSAAAVDRLALNERSK